MQIISNGKLKSSEHRVVTNSTDARTTAAFFFNPCGDSMIEPAKALTDNESPPLYRAYQYKEFFINYAAKIGNAEAVLEPFKLQA